MKYLIIALMLTGCLTVTRFPPPSRPEKLMCEMYITPKILCRTYCLKLSDGTHREIVEILRDFNGMISKTEVIKEVCTTCDIDGVDWDCHLNNPYKTK